MRARFTGITRQNKPRRKCQQKIEFHQFYELKIRKGLKSESKNYKEENTQNRYSKDLVNTEHFWKEQKSEVQAFTLPQESEKCKPSPRKVA